MMAPGHAELVDPLELECDTIRPWPSPAGGEVELGGWVRSTEGVARVVVEAEPRARQAAGLDHPQDGGRGNPRRWTAFLAAAALRGGSASVRIVARNLVGQTATKRLESPLPIPPIQPWSIGEYRAALDAGRGLLVCHRPSFDGRTIVGDVLAVEGWAYAPAGIEAIFARLGDDPAIRASCALPTPGLTAKLGDRPGLGRSGFRVVINTQASPLGPRRLAITAQFLDGTTMSWGTKVLVDPDRLYRHHLIQQDRSTKPIPPGGLGAPRLLVWPLSPSTGIARSLATQAYPWWSLAEDDDHALAEGLRKAAGADAALTVFVGPGAELRAGALSALAAAALHQPEDDAFFADHDRYDEGGQRHHPSHKPAWSPELLLATDYVGPLLALRSRAARVVLAQGEPVTSHYDLALRLHDLDLSVGHLPQIAATLGYGSGRPDPADARAAIERLARRRERPVVIHELDGVRRRVSWPVLEPPLVTIVIPTNGRDQMIARCVHSIVARSVHRRIEIVVVDTSPGGLNLDDIARTGLALRTVPLTGPFNFSTACNLGAAEGSGEVLLFLNDDTEVESPDWIERMLDHALAPGVGPVGAKLLYPDRTIQHGGVLITLPGGAACNMLLGLPEHPAGPPGMLDIVRNCSAVTGACMMISCGLFDSLGGFDETFPVEWGDVDLCLRSGSAGHRVVWTPHAVLVHHESMSRGSQTNAEHRRLFARRWGKMFADGDPYYPRVFDAHGRFAYRERLYPPLDG